MSITNKNFCRSGSEMWWILSHLGLTGWVFSTQGKSRQWAQIMYKGRDVGSESEVCNQATDIASLISLNE